MMSASSVSVVSAAAIVPVTPFAIGVLMLRCRNHQFTCNVQTNSDSMTSRRAAEVLRDNDQLRTALGAVNLSSGEINVND